MAADCYTQLGFGFQAKLVVDFAGGTLTTDAGLLLVREFDEQLGLSADVVARITDTRDARYVTHELDALVRQRLYQIAAGYEDVNDANRLRHDPTFQIVAADGRTTLGSQPTLSRLENAIEWPAIQRLARTGIDWFCAYAYGPDEHPADLVLDLDSTDDPTHGAQQLALFHGWYDQHMYHPLLWFEGRTGLLLRSRLRPGRDPSAACVVEELQHLLPPLRRRFPHTPIFLRGDAGMATPAVEAKLEAEGVRYVLGIGTNKVFTARVAGLVTKAECRYGGPAAPSTCVPASGIARNRGRISDAFWSRSTSRRRASTCASWSRIGAGAPPISLPGTMPAGRPRIGSKSSNSTSTPTGLAVIASAPTRSGCSSTASRSCCSPISVGRSSRARAWRRPPSARSGSSCSKSPVASSAVSAGSGFISRLTGPGTRSSPTVIAPWRAPRPNVVKRDILSRRAAGSDGGVFAHAPSRSFRGVNARFNPSAAGVTVSSLSIITVTEGDGAASDSFMNYPG